MIVLMIYVLLCCTPLMFLMLAKQLLSIFMVAVLSLILILCCTCGFFKASRIGLSVVPFMLGLHFVVLSALIMIAIRYTFKHRAFYLIMVLDFLLFYDNIKLG